jgi:hypothetical protein
LCRERVKIIFVLHHATGAEAEEGVCLLFLWIHIKWHHQFSCSLSWFLVGEVFWFGITIDNLPQNLCRWIYN